MSCVTTRAGLSAAPEQLKPLLGNVCSKASAPDGRKGAAEHEAAFDARRG